MTELRVVSVDFLLRVWEWARPDDMNPDLVPSLTAIATEALAYIEDES